MKTKILFILIAFTSFCNAQISFPDTNFKNALINSLCVDADLNGSYESDADLNNDGLIQATEALAVQRLNISNKNIIDLTGLQYFLNLKFLLCNNNQISTLSLSTNFENLTYLENLDCSHNYLTNLNLYPSSFSLNNLKTVNCSFNQISTLTLSYTTLINLNISNNNLSSIIQINTNYYNLTDLNISNNQFTSFIVDCPSLATFDYVGNPLTSLTYNEFSNNPINVSNLGALQTLTFNEQISVPSINLTTLPNLSFLKVNYATIQNDLVLANLPSLNSIDFENPSNNLTLSNNLGFTELNDNGAYMSPGYTYVIANNFNITNTSSITSINLNFYNVVNFSIDNMPNLTSLKIPDGELLQSISLNILPQLQTLEIGSSSATYNTNCINLTIQNFNNLNSILIKSINLGNLVLNSLPSLVSFTNNGSSCDDTTSSLTLANLPLLYDAKILDPNLSNLTVSNLTSLHDLQIYSKRLSSLNLNSLPQLYNFSYTLKLVTASVILPILTIQNFPNLHSIYLNRVNIGGISLGNLPNLYSFISANELGSSYTSPVIDYAVSNLPSLYYVQLDQIRTTNLSFSNVPSLNTLKMKKSLIGATYSFQNLSLEQIYIDNMSTLNNISFNSLTNFKLLNITDCSNIQSLNLGNTNTSLQKFLLTTSIAIQSTSITSLNFTNFPQLNSLTVNYKLTSLILSNLPNLIFLNCSSNKLNSIALTNFPSLNEVICNYIQPTITSSTYKFPLTLNLPQLTKLNVNYNNNGLANLDLSNCPMLNELHYILSNSSSSGSIPYINMRNGNSNFTVFESNPIINICVDDTVEKVLLQSLNSNLSNTIFTTYCSFNPAGTFFTTQGNSLLDSDNNGCDSNDILFPMINLNIEAGGISSSYFANNSGGYSLPLLAGQYTITPAFENPTYFTFSPATINITLPTATNPYIQNFCVSPNGNHNDLEITLLPLSSARPGFNALYKLVYKNKGNQMQSGNINLSFDDSISNYVSSSQALSNQTTNLLNWTFSNLQPFESRTITVNLNLNSSTATPPVVSGAILNCSSEIIGLTDDNPNDNISYLNQTVVNAFDPNDKTCLEGQIVTSNVVGKYVHYMIRFENTGTANAQNIVVKDLIDLTKFDLTSLVPISGSNSFYTRISKTNQVEFIFENINLPFASGTNDGYLVFKIKTKPSLVVGDTFSNQVNIYFDYNNPIITNNYVTTIQNSLGLQEDELTNDISIYPNPVKDFLNFKTEHNILKIEIYDITGRILSSNSVSENKIDLSKLKTGNYILKIYTEKQILNTKIIKE